MKLEKYALIAEIIGGIAIVAGLAVLIVEIRGNTEAIRAQTAQATFSTSTESFYYPEGNVALARAESEGLDALTLEERAHADALISAIFNAFNNNYYQYRQGNLDEEIQDAYFNRLRVLLSSPIYRERWVTARDMQTESFRDYVDEIVENLEQ